MVHEQNNQQNAKIKQAVAQTLFSFPKRFFINLRLSSRRFQNSPFRAQTDEIADLPPHQDLLTKNILMIIQRVWATACKDLTPWFYGSPNVTLYLFMFFFNVMVKTII
jgi:hypothetical protein